MKRLQRRLAERQGRRRRDETSWRSSTTTSRGRPAARAVAEAAATPRLGARSSHHSRRRLQLRLDSSSTLISLCRPFDACSIVYQWSLRSQWCNLPSAVTTTYLLCPRPIMHWRRLSVCLSVPSLTLSQQYNGVSSWKLAPRKPMTRVTSDPI